MKRIFARLFPSKSFKKLRSILDELEKEFDNPAFEIVREKLENSASKSTKGLDNVMNSNIDLESWVAGHIANISGDLVESGEYHIYRGVLNSMGPGKNLLRLFDQSTDFTLERGVIKQEFADEQKKQVRLNMQGVG